MIKSKAQQIFILGLGLMLLFRIISKIPLFEGEIAGFDGGKLLKIIVGVVFIVTTFLIYKKSKKQVS